MSLFLHLFPSPSFVIQRLSVLFSSKEEMTLFLFFGWKLSFYYWWNKYFFLQNRDESERLKWARQKAEEVRWDRCWTVNLVNIGDCLCQDLCLWFCLVTVFWFISFDVVFLVFKTSCVEFLSLSLTSAVFLIHPCPQLPLTCSSYSSMAQNTTA